MPIDLGQFPRWHVAVSRTDAAAGIALVGHGGFLDQLGRDFVAADTIGKCAALGSESTLLAFGQRTHMKYHDESVAQSESVADKTKAVAALDCL